VSVRREGEPQPMNASEHARKRAQTPPLWIVADLWLAGAIVKRLRPNDVMLPSPTRLSQGESQCVCDGLYVYWRPWRSTLGLVGPRADRGKAGTASQTGAMVVGRTH
jgi:hypothetical protein